MTGLDQIVSLARAITGWNVTDAELLRAGELGITLARLFNVREGKTDDDDRLPDRLHDPLPFASGTHAGIPRVDFARARKLYYQMLGWDEHGFPTPWKGAELGVWRHLSSSISVQPSPVGSVDGVPDRGDYA
jgi:aldehyde:ferredoxin oxidoreductase